MDDGARRVYDDDEDILYGDLLASDDGWFNFGHYFFAYELESRE